MELTIGMLQELYSNWYEKYTMFVREAYLRKKDVNKTCKLLEDCYQYKDELDTCTIGVLTVTRFLLIKQSFEDLVSYLDGEE
jgi:hypothetical protein